MQGDKERGYGFGVEVITILSSSSGSRLPYPVELTLSCRYDKDYGPSFFYADATNFSF